MAKRKKLLYVDEPPEGLFYLGKFLSPEEEQGILRHVETQLFEPYDHHGYKANREVVYFGNHGYYNATVLAQAEPMPAWLCPLRDRFAALMGLAPEALAMALVAKYTIGAGIGWHTDRPQFGPTVMGVSLSSDAEMRFRRYVADNEELFKIQLEHGSAYLISGAARLQWQHGMTPVRKLRYSITFRTLKSDVSDQDPLHDPSYIASRLTALNVNFSALPKSNEDPTRQLKLAL